MSGDWSIVSSSDAASLNTPTSSHADSIHDDQSGFENQPPSNLNLSNANDGQSVVEYPSPSSTNLSNIHSIVPARKYDRPDTALAIFRYEFIILPNQPIHNEFTLKHHRSHWMHLLRGNKGDVGWTQRLRNSIDAIGQADNGAAKLLLVIFWAVVLQKQEEASVSVFESLFFWSFAYSWAVEALLNFYGAPEQYLGWIQNVKQRNKGCLKGIVSEQGQKFFTVNKNVRFTWLSDDDGFELDKHVFGELPTLKLELI